MISTLTDPWEQTALQLFLRTVAVVCVKHVQVYQTEFNYLKNNNINNYVRLKLASENSYNKK